MDHWDGAVGTVMASYMARSNADMEQEAIEDLDPQPGWSVLEVGYGPGVGLAMLADRVGPHGWVAGADPSRAMARAARKRNRAGIAAGTIDVEQASAEQLPWRDASFDGVIAVNTVMLWDPVEADIVEVARVLKPGARFVTVTHDWAIRKHAESVAQWLAGIIECFRGCGLVEPVQRLGTAHSGGSVLLAARRA